MSVIKHVTLNRSDDWSTDIPLYTSQLDMIVARRLDTRGLHFDSDDTPEQIKTIKEQKVNFWIHQPLLKMDTCGALSQGRNFMPMSNVM